MSYELVRLDNGSFSLRSRAYGEIMHPAIGPAVEADALYVKQLDLIVRFANHKGPFVVWDVGLGAAANAIAVLNAIAQMSGRLILVSFDSTVEPLRFALDHTERLPYLAPFRSQLQRLMIDRQVQFEQTTWQLHLGNFPELLSTGLPGPNAILFDPFSPAKNPEMWTAPLFARMYELLGTPCSLANYSRSTMVRASLLLAGFFVGRGEPIARKEETTIAANSLSLVRDPLDTRWLERAAKSHSAEPLWTPPYRKAPLTPETLDKLRAHPQFSR